jgi:hypothetical protein
MIDPGEAAALAGGAYVVKKVLDPALAALGQPLGDRVKGWMARFRVQDPDEARDALSERLIERLRARGVTDEALLRERRRNWSPRSYSAICWWEGSRIFERCLPDFWLPSWIRRNRERIRHLLKSSGN